MLRVVLTVCCVCVACELHGRATQHNHHTSKAQRLPHKRAACVPKCCTCHTNTIGFFYPVCNSDCCHDILHPLSYCQPMSLPALLFRTLRTLADSRTKDAKYHGSNLNYKLDKKNRWYLCGRCNTLGRMLLFCVAGAGLWKYDGCVAWPCHATHMQHARNTQSTQHATRALFL